MLSTGLMVCKEQLQKRTSWMHLQLSSEIPQKVRKNGGGGGGDTVMGYDTLMLKLDIFWQLFFLKMNLLHISIKYKPVMQHPANGPPDQLRNRGKVLNHTISFRLFGEVALIHAFSRAKCYILAFRFPKRWFTIVQRVVFQHAKQLWAFWLLQTDIIERIQRHVSNGNPNK